MHYYQHHIGDFIKATSNLDDHQLATYLRMVWSYYSDEKPISGDLEDVAFAMRSDEKTVRLLLRHFFVETADGWAHSRCDREIAEYRAKGQKARESANARWKDANALRTHSERIANAMVLDANHKPITNNHKREEASTPSGSKRSRLPDDFTPNETGLKKAAEKFLDVKAELEKFRDYHIGKGSVMVDWQAAFRTWLGNARTFAKPTNAPAPVWGKPGSAEYAKVHQDATWWRDAGFTDVWDANSSMCWHHNASQFKNGKKLEAVTA